MAQIAVKPETVREFYDCRYAHSGIDIHQGRELEHVADVLQVVYPAPARVLDYGCGEGGWMRVLQQTFPSAHISGIDISGCAVEKARAAYPDSNFEIFDGLNAPYPDRTFDCVFCYHVLEHVVDLDATVSDISRLVRPGGAACVILPCGNRGSLEERIVSWLRSGREQGQGNATRFFYEDSGHLRRLTSDQLVRLFEQNGLVLETAWFSNQLWGGVSWIGKSGPRFVVELCLSRAPRNVRSAVALMGLGLGLLVLSVPLRVYGLGERQYLFSNHHTLSTVMRFCMFPAWMLAAPVGFVIDSLVRREWVSRRKKPCGSGMFLVLRATLRAK